MECTDRAIGSLTLHFESMRGPIICSTMQRHRSRAIGDQELHYPQPIEAGDLNSRGKHENRDGEFEEDYGDVNAKANRGEQILRDAPCRRASSDRGLL
jgi:hypothetical protein